MKHQSSHSPTSHGSIKSYTLGFVFSVLLTLAAYIPTTMYLESALSFSHQSLIVIILGLALAQLIVQLYFFLHLGQEPKPRLNLLFFLSTVGIILIVLVGSLWIMSHLNYHMLPGMGMDMEHYFMEDEAINRPVPETLGQ